MTLPRLAAGPVWDDFLEDGEYLVWHGRPDGEKLVSRDSGSKAALSLGFFLFVGVGVNVMWRDFFDPGMWPVWIVFSLMLATGVWMLVGSHFRGRRARRGTWYTLTNRRAFVATDLGAKHLKSWPVTKDAPLRHVKALDDRLGYVFFAQEITPARDHDDTDDITEIGFELIENSDSVFLLFQRVAAQNTGDET